MNNIFKIARHEFRMTAMNKAFIILTILGPFLILAVTVLPTVFNQNAGIEKDTVVAVIGGDDNIHSVLSRYLSAVNINVSVENDEEYVRQAVLDGNMHGYLKIPDDYLNTDVFQYKSKTGTDLIVSETIRAILSQIIITMRLENSGLTTEQIIMVSTPPQFFTGKISSQAVETESDENQDLMEIMFTCIGFTLLIYMTILLYGQSIGRSVLLEKTSKTVDIMLSSVRPLDLLYGKLLGIGIAAIFQYSIWMLMAFLIAGVAGPALGFSIPASINVTNFMFLILFFILAFLLYSSIYAALGSGSDDEQHFGQLSMIPLVFLILPMVAVSVIVFNPDGSISKAFSYIPFTSPLIMLIRVIVSMPPLSDFLISGGILIATIPIIMFAGSKIFRIGILMTGKRYTLKEILRWIRVK